MVDSLVLSQEAFVMYYTRPVTQEMVRNSKGWMMLNGSAKESLMCKTWSFATCALARCNCCPSLASYRSTEQATDQLLIVVIIDLVLICHILSPLTTGIPAVFQEEELARLQYRLGMAYFFPFFQPENAKFQLVAGWKCMWHILKCSGRW